MANCPKCGDCLGFFGLGQVLRKTNPKKKSSPCFRCNGCGTIYADEDFEVNKKLLMDTLTNSNKSSIKEVENITRTRIDLPKPGEPIAFFGEFVAILYEIDGRPYIYESSKKSPSWGYYPGENGGCFIVWGGDLLWELSGNKTKDVKCSCGGIIVFDGIDEENNKVMYKCRSCKKQTVSNNDNPEMIEKAAEYAEVFNMKELDQIQKTKIDLPGPNEPLIHCGTCLGLVYKSDKEGKRGQHYIHHAGRNDSGESDGSMPFWSFYPGNDGGAILIYGGDMKVDLDGKSSRHAYKGWLVD